MNILSFLTTLFGEHYGKMIAMIIFSVGLAWAIPKYIVTTTQFEKKVIEIKQDSETKTQFLQIQLWDNKIQTLQSSLYQLKKLKKLGNADEDDLEELENVKSALNILKAKRDSLQQVLMYKK